MTTVPKATASSDTSSSVNLLVPSAWVPKIKSSKSGPKIRNKKWKQK